MPASNAAAPKQGYVAKRIFTVKVNYAENLYDTKWLKTQTPYVEVTCGKKVLKTEFAKKGGKHPKWHDEVQFTYDNEPKLTFKVWHKGICGRSYVCDGELSLPPTTMCGAIDIPLVRNPHKRKPKTSGNLNITMTWHEQNQITDNVTPATKTSAPTPVAQPVQQVQQVQPVMVAAPPAIQYVQPVMQQPVMQPVVQQPQVRVKWVWEDASKKNHPYEQCLQAQVEQAYQANPNGMIDVVIQGTSYSISFKHMSQMNKSTQKRRPIHRQVC